MQKTLDIKVSLDTENWANPVTVKLKVPSNVFMADWIDENTQLEADPEKPGELKMKRMGNPTSRRKWVKWLDSSGALDTLIEKVWDTGNDAIIAKTDYKKILLESDTFVSDLIYGDASHNGLLKQSELNRHSHG